MSAPEGASHEIVIVRRHGDHEEAHHGGVWKIAFADFMTAMMAFFLVMWLISASDKNREAIARYFNPLKLVDTTTRPKGLNDSKKDDASVEPSGSPKETDAKAAKNEKPSKAEKAEKEDKPDKPGKEEKASKDEKPPTHSEAKLFQDPYGVLSEIAHGSPQDSGKPQGQRSAEGAKGGDNFRDPFAPPPPAAAADPDADLELASPPPSAPPAPARGSSAKQSPPDAGPEAAAAEEPPPAAEPAKSPKSAARSGANGESATAAVALRNELAKAIGASDKAPLLEVRKTSEGLLISLTDKNGFAMFAMGSAEPDRKLVLLMDKVSVILRSRPGKIVIRGHTDARPYRTGPYDNWRLSADRAQMAHYMLVRGGLDEKRIERIEGYADRVLKTPADPAGAQNRRIELLLREDKS